MSNKTKRLDNKIRVFLGLVLLMSMLLGLCGAPQALALQNYLDYQGRLSDNSGNLLTGNYYITFCVYAVSAPGANCSPVASPTVGGVASLGSALWGETQYFSATNSPSNAVTNGVFNAKLGSASAFPSTLFSSSDLWIGVNVYSGASWDGQMSPLEELLSAGYANNAGTVGGFSASQAPIASQIPVLDGSGNLTLPGSVTIGGSVLSGGALGISSGGSAALTLTSKSGTLVLGAGTNSITNTDATTALTINPTGNIQFFNSTNTITSGGNVTFAGNITANGTSTNTFAYNTTINNGNITINPVSSPGSTPTLAQTAGGSLGAATYYVKYTWVNGDGETTPSGEANIAVSASNLLKVTVPAFPATVVSANVYVATSTNTETKQGSIVVSAGTWTEPTSGLVAGTAMPNANTAGGALIAAGSKNLFSSPAALLTSYGTVNIGGGAFDGATTGHFTGSSNGTLLALNAVSGFSGNLVDLQVAGASKLSIDNAGNIVTAGTLAVTGFNNTFTNNSGRIWINPGINGTTNAIASTNFPDTASEDLSIQGHSSTNLSNLNLKADNVNVSGTLNSNGNNIYTTLFNTSTVTGTASCVSGNLSVTVPTASSKVLITISAYITSTLPAGDSLELSIIRNGTTITTSITRLFGAQYTSSAGTWVDAPGSAGTYTYCVSANYDGVASQSQGMSGRASLLVL